MPLSLTTRRMQEVQSQSKASHTHDLHRQCPAQKPKQTLVQQVDQLLAVKQENATHLNPSSLLYLCNRWTQTQGLSPKSGGVSVLSTGLDP